MFKDKADRRRDLDVKQCRKCLCDFVLLSTDERSDEHFNVHFLFFRVMLVCG